MSILAKIVFRLRIGATPMAVLRTTIWRIAGADIAPGTYVAERCSINWPHQLRLGRDCVLETDIQFKYAAPYQSGAAPAISIGDRAFLGRGTEFNAVESIRIGDDCLIGSGCKFIDTSHGRELGLPMNRQPCSSAAVILESDIWLGVNVVVLKGVTIGTGAIVAAGAIVNRDVPAGEIWAGVPARKIGERGGAMLPVSSAIEPPGAAVSGRP